MGAAWVFGIDPEKNPLVPPTLPKGALVKTDWDNSISWEAMGSIDSAASSPRLSDADRDESASLLKLSWGLFKERQSAAQARAYALVGGDADADESIWNEISKLKSKRFPGLDGLNERQRLLLRYAWAAETEHDYAAPLESLSMRWWDADSTQADEQHLWRDGYKTIAERWASGLTDVRLGERVQGIVVHSGDDGGTGGGGGGGGGGASPAHVEATLAHRVEVQLNSGEVLRADACVITLPLGVLKLGAVTFSPALPDDKLAAIGRLGVGLLNKVVLRFETCFWAAADASAAEPHVLVRVPTAAARCLPAAMETPMILNLRPVTGANVLVAYFNCEVARHLEAQSDQALQAHVVALLGSMFGEEAVRAANVLECLVSRWASDELASGSYSYVAVGASPADRALLARAEGPLLFAGEATSHGGGKLCEGGYPATVYGAYLSGLRASAEAANLLGLGATGAKAARRRGRRGGTARAKAGQAVDPVDRRGR